MASQDRLIRIILSLEDRASKQAKAVSNTLADMGKSVTSLGQSMSVGITAPLVAAGAAMFKTFADFESVIVEIGARTGATADEMKKLSDFAIEMGRTTAFSATEAAQALLELTSSGSSAAEAMQQLPSVLNLAVAGALDLGQAADGVTDVLAAFGLEAEASTRVANALAKAAGASSATVSDLLQGFSNIGPVARQFGISVEDTAAALAVLAENGIKGAEGGTQLRSMLLNMSRDTEVTRGAWEKLGVSLYDAQGNMRGLDAVFKDINKAMEGMSMEEQNRLAHDLAGSYGIVGFNALRAANGVEGMRMAMVNAATAEEVAAARLNTLSGKFDQLMGSVETLGIVLGGLSQGPLLWFIEQITNAVNALTAWAQANPQLAQTAIIILSIVAALGPLLIIIGQIIGAIAAIKAGFVALAGAGAVFAAIGGAIMAVLPIILLFIATAAMIWAVANDFMGVKTAIVNAANGIGQGLTAAKDAVWGFITDLGRAWGEMAQKATTAFAQLAVIALRGMLELIPAFKLLGSDIMKGLIIGVLSKINEFIAAIRRMADEAAQAVRNALGIKSPSKVMMDIGQQIVAGLQKGVGGMAGAIGVNVNGASVSGSAPVMSGASYGSSATSNVYNIYPPAGTTQEQAEEIMKIISKKSKQKGARDY